MSKFFSYDIVKWGKPFKKNDFGKKIGRFSGRRQNFRD